VAGKVSPTIVLLIANSAMYVITSILTKGFLETSGYVLEFLGQNNSLVFQGYYWQFFTSMFVHADITHIVMNMLFLLIFGFKAETLFKNVEYLGIYLLSGLAGGFLSLLLGPNTISVGASGAIFGLFGANVIYMRKVVGLPVTGSLVYAVFFLLITSLSPNVNMLAHLGGLIIGLVMGYFLAKNRKALNSLSYPFIGSLFKEA